MRLRQNCLARALVGFLMILPAPLLQAATQVEEVSCAAKPTVRGISEEAAKRVEILADDISFPERGVVHLRGYTQLIRGGHRVYADELIYDKNENSVVARGVVKFQSPEGDIILTSVLNYDIETRRIETGPAEFLVADRQSRLLGDGHGTVNAFGTADRVVLRNGELLDLTNAHVTSCLNGEKDMTFSARNLSVNTDEGVRTAERAKVRISAPQRHDRLNEAIDTLE